MFKNPLLEKQMSDAVYVDKAADWAKELTRREARGPGDIENAWRRLEVRYGIPSSAFWSLRYRRPKSIATGLFARLYEAWNAERERQMRMLQHETAIAEKLAGPDSAAVAAVKAVLANARPEGALPENDAED